VKIERAREADPLAERTLEEERRFEAAGVA
jgi:hypothetical protein